VHIINYKPAPTIREFILDYKPGELFYDWIVGPVGSGKTTGDFMKLVYMAGLQAPQADKIRRTKAVIVRNTAPQLKDTTLASWNYWFQDGVAGSWRETSKNFTLRFGDVECEVLFRPLDTPEDVARVLSLEVTFAIIDEFVQIPRPIVDALSARLGRYPPANEGGATNWGMWGASNPDTEDNWWFDHLNNNDKEVERVILGEDAETRQAKLELLGNPDRNIKYFLQPSGFSDAAENLEYLPGNRKYYTNQAKGKSDAWIKQFIEAEWGFSVAGKPVVATFRPELHLSKSALRFNPFLPLVVGFDPGLAGSALVFGQQDVHGRLLILGELVQSNYGAQRLIRERLKPYLLRRFPGAKLVIAPDPASAIRGQRDEVPVVAEFKKHYDVKIETNNRLPLRLDAYDHFCSTLTEVGPALLVDAQQCPMLVRALKGGWRYAMDPKKVDQMKSAEPEKNQYSHVGDAGGYLARYFHKQTERELRYGAGPNGVRKPFVPPRSFGPGYHFK